jgi:hypothetical protein
MKSKLLAAGVLIATLSSTSIASATIYLDPFSSNTGTTQGTDAFGNTWKWTWATKTFSYSGTYKNSTYDADGFEISFVGGQPHIASSSFNGFAGTVFGSNVSFAYFPPLSYGDTFTSTIVLSSGTPYPGITATYLNSKIVNPPVPEPATWALMLAGFAGLGFAGYRRARAQTA